MDEMKHNLQKGDASNLVERLRELSRTRAEEVALVVATERDGELVETTLTYGELDARARAVAADLQARFDKGDRALLLLDNNEYYVVAFLACLYAGLVAVPVFPPESIREQHLVRLMGIARDSQARVILSSRDVLQMAGSLLEQAKGVEALSVDEVDSTDAKSWVEFSPQPADVAFLQYTSGSTSAPKGVMVTHANLMANELAMERALDITSQDVLVSWLPLYHDMGLIGGLLQPIYQGIKLVLMSPAFFLQRPVRWLEAISRHRGTISGGPDFSFRLCLDRIKDSQLAALDLSSWRIAFSGAEPVRHDTLASFSERFSVAAFDSESVCPCYGLAEATLMVSSGVPDLGMVTTAFSTESLRRGTVELEELGKVAVACGVVVEDHTVTIRHEQSGNLCQAAEIGEIWFSGPSVAAGYWQKDQETSETFVERDNKRWLRTGDLGFFHEGQLYIVGRIKDVIIVRGHNLYPQDIERAIENEVDLVRKGRVAAFAVSEYGAEGIGIAVEVSRSVQKLVPAKKLVQVLAETISQVCGESLSVALLLNPGALPKTSSGKLQRRACQKAWREQALDAFAIYEFGAFLLGGEKEADGYEEEPPLDELQQSLADIWAKTLSGIAVDQISAQTHFFAVGGNSLLATQVVSAIEQRWNIHFPIRSLFEHPRLSECADQLHHLLTGNKSRQPVAIPILSGEQRSVGQVLSSAQQRQWFLWKLDPTNTAYHVQGALRLKGTLHNEILSRTFAELVQRHASLRTLFKEGSRETLEEKSEAGVEAYVASDMAPLSLPVVNLENVSDAEDRLQDLMAELNRTPFSLTDGPLVRASLVRLSQSKQSPQEHVLMIVMHHIVTDGVSMQIMLDELSALYSTALSDQKADLPELTVQYTDYAHCQRNWLESAECAQQLNYWRNQLGDEHPPLLLMTDHPRQADSHYEAGQFEFTLPQMVSDGLRQQSVALGGTVFVSLLAGFQVLLARYTSQGDIRVGVPVANRGSLETRNLVGFFVNTLVLRNNIGRDTSLSQVLRQATSSAMAGLENQSLPFDLLVDALQPERSLSYNPLFQVMFNHLQEDFHVLRELSGLSVEYERYGADAAQFELTLDTREDSTGQIRATFTYAKELFEAETIKRMAGHYQAILEALVAQPEQKIADIELLSDTEQQQLMHWSVNSEHYDAIKPVHHLIEQQAANHPNSTALIFDGQRLSYAELNTRANQLAHYLIAQGVRPETKVGIAVERSIEMVVGLLGILKAGAAYVPLDPEYPAERLAYIVADSGVQLLLTQSYLAGQMLIQGVEQVVLLDQMDLSDRAHHNPEVAVHGDNLAYVIYTSGSTGKPKGAAIAHRSLASCMTWMQHKYGLTDSDTVLHKAPFGFDVSVWEIFWPLTSGVRLVVANPGDHRDPERITQLIRQHQVTTLNFVPAMLQAFLAHEGIEKETHLRYVICGGEAMPAATQAEALRRLKGVSLQNLYGPTETTIHVTQWTCREDGETLVPIGRPIAETSAYILDDSLNVVPQGVAGELYIGGVLLSRGYLHRADLSAERFVANPFDAQGSRLYRTGDLVRWNREGQLEYLGRIDHQVKIRGLRIELGEVEAQLLAQDDVKEAVVIALDSPSGTQLVGYVASPSPSLEAYSLRERLAKTLPDYMVPSTVMILDSLPLNANGKVDRKALPEPEWLSSNDYEAPQGEVEQALAEIWSDVLGVEQVGRHDDFFELGGHSLLALKVQEKLRQRDWHVGVKTLFLHPQLSSFAEMLRNETGDDAVIVPPNKIPTGCRDIQPEMLTLIELSQDEINGVEKHIVGGAANIQDIYPLAPLQEGILFHHLMQKEGDVYVTSHMLAFEEKMALQSFIASFNQVVKRHDVLRTAVLWEGLREPVQVVCRHAELTVRWLEVDNQANTNAQEQLAQHAKAGHYRIDVRQPLMVDAIAMHDSASDRWLLQLLSHHLIFDHTTLELLIGEIAFFQDGKETLLSAPVPFRNMVAQARLGVSREQHEHFFSNMLGTITEPTTPFDLMDTHGDGKSIDESKLVLDRDLSLQLREQAKKQGVSVTALFHLAWGMLVGKASKSQDVVFGTVLFGRMQSVDGAGSAMGLSMNTLPFRVTLKGQDVCQALKATQSLLTGVLHHEHATLSLAHSCSGVESGAPLFSSLLNYRHSSQSTQSNASWQNVSLLSGEERTNYPISMSVDDFGKGFQLMAQVCGGIKATDVCDYMYKALYDLATALDSAPRTPVTTVDVLNDTTLERLLHWGTNDRQFLEFNPVHGLFAQQVGVQADEVALIFNDTQMSYRELDTQSNRLAHYLMRQGITRENRIAIALDRSPTMIIALLAILKAGATYVALDPQYPSERLAYILQDSGVKLLLTQSGTLQDVPLPQDCIELDVDTTDVSTELSSAPTVELRAENLAYVLYTSGSTGRPKGVMVSHGALSNFLLGMSELLTMSPKDRLVAATSLSFDISSLELYLPLICGAQTVLADRHTAGDGYLLANLIQKSEANVFQATPSGWRMVLDSGVIDFQHTKMKAICGGEALPPDLSSSLIEQGAQLWNMYGPTETTVWSTAVQVASASSSIGLPIAHTNVHILDHELNYCLPGVAGELCIGGAGLARGYLNKASLSAQSFVASPLGNHGERLYRTGDLVRWAPQGYLEYIGRIDHQVKVRGFRIELGEIEAQLLNSPAIKDAAVAVHNEVIGEYLVAYIMPSSADEQSWDETLKRLKEKLAMSLPSYMVPDLLIRLDNMPLTPNGKLDRKALPKPSFTGSKAYETPQGELEKAVAHIWCELLGEEKIGRHDNFFELGGHSLLAMRMINRIQGTALFKHPLRLYDFMTSPTIALLCADEKPDHTAGIHSVLNKTMSDCAPLFCLHSGLGTIMGYLPLAKRLDGQRTVIGISCRVLSDPSAQAQCSSLEKMVDDYVAAIRDIQPAGPYHIMGWSLGGTLAAMVTARLEALEEKVVFLGMIDMYVQERDHVISNDCTACFTDFLSSVSVSNPLPSFYEAMASISDPFVQEEELIYVTETLLDSGKLVLKKNYEGASSAEIVRLFLANFSIRLASAASLDPLKKINTSASCWWVEGRPDTEEVIERLSKDLGCVMAHEYVCDDHTGIISNSRVLDKIANALMNPSKDPQRIELEDSLS
jgi:amino acid adenylation domain-containing protein